MIVQPSKLIDGYWFWLSDTGTHGHTATETEATRLAKDET